MFRSNKRPLIISSTTIFGLLFQAVGMAVVGPIFLFFHLTTSPTLSKLTNVSLDIDAHEISAVPFSTVTGYIIPTILMSLHAPTYISFEQKTNLVRLWQIFPVLCYISQHFWKYLFSLHPTSTSNLHFRLQTLNRVYSFGIWCAAATHLGTWSISLLAYFFPTLFASGIAHRLVPKAVFLPPMPWWNVRADSIATGSHWFLQWDEILACSMYLLWACSLYLEAKKQAGRTTAISEVLGLVFSALLVGPAGAVLVALQGRDDIAFNGPAQVIRGNTVVPDHNLTLQQIVERHFESKAKRESTMTRAKAPVHVKDMM